MSSGRNNDADRGGRSDKVNLSGNASGSNSISASGSGSKNRGSDSVRSSGKIESAGFLDKHGGKLDGKSGKDKSGSASSGALASADSSRKSGNASGANQPLKVNDLHDSNTFLNKHGNRRQHDNSSGDLQRGRNDDTSRNLGSRHGGHHGGGHHHGHHHGHRHSSFFFGFGGPFYGFGYGSPWGFNPWYGGYGLGGYGYGGFGGYGYGGFGGYWGRPYWGGYGWGSPYGFGGFGWPYGGLSVGYGSRNFGFLYNSGFGYGSPGYGFGPNYWYDPYCSFGYSSGATYIVESPTYAAVPRTETIVAPIASDASAARIEPVPVSTPVPPAPKVQTNSDPVASESDGDFARDGEVAFKQSDYKGAVRAWRHALLDEPQNGTLYMMIAQGHFQLGEFDQAAGATQQGMMALPKDKWGVVVKNYTELYGKTKDYVEQLKVLEKAVEEKPKDPARRFVLGFHFLFLDYPKEALRELTALREVAKNDKLGEELFKMAEEELKKKESKSAAPKSDAPNAEVPSKPDGN